MNATEREKIWGWYNIAMYFEVHENTAKRWGREEEAFRRLIRRWRRRVFAYEDELKRWQRQMESGFEENAMASGEYASIAHQRQYPQQGAQL